MINRKIDYNINNINEDINKIKRDKSSLIILHIERDDIIDFNISNNVNKAVKKKSSCYDYFII